jgi:hypothetical protein
MQRVTEMIFSGVDLDRAPRSTLCIGSIQAGLASQLTADPDLA